MSCKAWENLLQTYLDEGDKSLFQHLNDCTDCASQRLLLQRFLRGLDQLQLPIPPVDLTDRLIAGVLPVLPRPTVRLRSRSYLSPRLALTLAASVLLALGLWLVWPKQPGQHPVAAANDPVLPQLSLRDSLQEAQTAMLSLSTRAANETVDTTTSLLPNLPISLEPMVPIEPRIEPLREATTGVEAFAPVTESARRAVGLFLRDLPFHRPPSEKKPG